MKCIVSVVYCVYPPHPLKGDMSYDDSYSSLSPPTFSSVDLKTPAKPKQVFISGGGKVFFFFIFAGENLENVLVKPLCGPRKVIKVLWKIFKQ